MKYIKTYEQLADSSDRFLDAAKKGNLDEIKKLPELPDSLEQLYCWNNNLTSLPELPDSLEQLYCSKNNLTTLPELPDSLKELYCWNNNLTTLPELPDSLKELYCSENNLPYNNLDEYKEWVINNQELIKNYGWVEAHKISYKMKKYNI